MTSIAEHVRKALQPTVAVISDCGLSSPTAADAVTLSIDAAAHALLVTTDRAAGCRSLTVPLQLRRGV